MNSTRRMDIITAANRFFLDSALTMLRSLFESHPSDRIDVYLFYSDLESLELLRFTELAGTYHEKRVIFMKVDLTDLQDFVQIGKFSVEIYYRIFAMEMLPQELDRVLYLDADVVVRKELWDLYETELNDAIFAVCKDIMGLRYGSYERNKRRAKVPKVGDYFNSGVLVFSLKKVRELNICETIKEDILNNQERYRYVDQDCLNHLYYDQVNYVDWKKYNCPPTLYVFLKSEIEAGNYIPVTQTQFFQPDMQWENYVNLTRKIYEEACIIHFIGDTKPWLPERLTNDTYDIFDECYNKYCR